MAYANNHDQRSVIVVRNHQLLANVGALNHPSTLIPGPQFGVINPSFGHLVPHLVRINPPVVGVDSNQAAFLARIDAERSQSLLQFMADVGLVPSEKEELRRKNVIDQLKQIVVEWIQRVAYQHRFPKIFIRAASATVLTYGSCGLGVHNSESDIDALCVGPSFATMAEDFFIFLRNMLASRPEVSEIHCVRDAKVPLMRFKFDGISVDLPYAQLKVTSVPENVDTLDPLVLKDIDETSWKSLSGVRANTSILQIVPNIEKFQSVLRCVKFWAKRRGVYGNLLGFFGGIHLAILAAFVCLRNPTASVGVLISIFFETFAFWPWPTPVILHEEMVPVTIPPEKRSLMPIQLPSSPEVYCHSNITRSTFNRIREEFLQGHYLTTDLLAPNFDWGSLFEPFPYAKRYTRFVKICLSASDQTGLGDWVGWVKSRFRCLLVKLEEVHGYCDPNPSEYFDPDVADPNVVFYWGLPPARNNFVDMDSVGEDFLVNLSKGYQGPPGDIALSVVPASQLPKTETEQFVTGTSRGSTARWRNPDFSQYWLPVYSSHLPHYLVGYDVPIGNL